MESLLLRGLEPTLRYWLKSFSREQFRLRGRSIQLYDLDVDGDALHASLGLPPTLRITEARVGTLEMRIASITNVLREPIVVDIDELELVISEMLLSDLGYIPGTLPSDPSGDGAGYGYSDKLADGMTIRIGRLHVILETKGGTSTEGRATRTPEVASITMRNMELFATNERWQVVPLNQARDFSVSRGAIYVFKKLQWETLCVDLLPPKHGRSTEKFNIDPARDRVWRGERLVDRVSGFAYITIQRTEMNRPFGLEVQIHVPEISSPRLSETGLQALLRFLTGVTICMNREDANVRSIQSADEAERTVIGLEVDNILLRVQDADYQLEFQMKSLHYVGASIVDENCVRTMTQCMVGYFSLRDMSTQRSCTLVQPNLKNHDANTKPPVPSFASEKLWPRIHPYESWLASTTETAPMLCMYSSQITPPPAAPALASQMVFQCQSSKIFLQETTCLRIASLIAECVVLESAVVLPDRSLHALYITVKELDLTAPVNGALMEEADTQGPFTGVRLHVAGFMMAKSPFLNFRVLDLDKDSACYSIWKGQPVESSHHRWVVRASHAAIMLETGSSESSAEDKPFNAGKCASGLWHCVEMSDLGVETAMLSADGQPLMTFIPSGGIVRLGISCKKCVATMSEEQYFFIMRMYKLAGKAVEALYEMNKSVVRKEMQMNLDSVNTEKLLDMVPTDTAVVMRLSALELKLLTSVSGGLGNEKCPQLAKLLSWEMLLDVTHKNLAGAAIVTSKLHLEDFRVECMQLEEEVRVRNETPFKLHVSEKHVSSDDSLSSSPESSVPSSASSSRVSSMGNKPYRVADKEPPQKEERIDSQDLPDLCAVIWIGKERGSMAPVGREGGDEGKLSPQTPFLDLNVETVIPYGRQEKDGQKMQVVVKVGGVRLGGSMCQFESLLQRYCVLGPGGVPGNNIKKLMEVVSHGPLSNFWSSSTGIMGGDPELHKSIKNLWDVGVFDVVDLDLQLLDWLFALEGVKIPLPTGNQEPSNPGKGGGWYTTFRSVQFKGQGSKAMGKAAARGTRTLLKPVQNLTMRIEGLQAVKHQSPWAFRAHSESAYSRQDTAEIGKTVPGLLDTDVSEIPQKKMRRLLDMLPNVTNTSGFDLEVFLVERGHEVDTDLGIGDWIVEKLCVGVQEPVKIGGTRQELEDLLEICKSEIKAVSRIATGAVKLFCVEPAIPISAIEQLTELGNGRLESALHLETDEAKKRREEIAPSNQPKSREKTKHEKDLSELEAAILTCQALCTKIQNHSGWIKEEKSFFCCNSSVRDHTPVNELNRLQTQLAAMKTLLASLKSERIAR